MRLVYVRITVDGIPRETSTNRKWDVNRWSQKEERAFGTKEDARGLNNFLESITTKINNYKTELLNFGKPVTSSDLIDFLNGKDKPKNTVLEEFQEHNNELALLVDIGDKAPGTLERYKTARSHVKEFIQYKYGREDLAFINLNFEFVKDYNLYLRTVRKNSHNTALKYISNFKKIVLRAVDKEIIPRDPFKPFVSRKIKIKKRPLTRHELKRIEDKVFASERLTTIRDVFVFQCYTGLSYVDAYQLTWNDIKEADDGSMWIMSNRQKSKSDTDIPLLPKALEIIAKYNKHPLCIKRGTVLPSKSNQKTNEYLKEIADLCEVSENLSTHKARRTFASTVTLNNGVSIHIVKEMLGHSSVKQTEEYAITEQESISKEMKDLQKRLENKTSVNKEIHQNTTLELQEELEMLKTLRFKESTELFAIKLMAFEAKLLKAGLSL